MRYYIADQHFYHRSLLTSMDKRPFSTVEEMNQYMIDQWNSRVKPDDEVIILGLPEGVVQSTKFIPVRGLDTTGILLAGKDIINQVPGGESGFENCPEFARSVPELPDMFNFKWSHNRSLISFAVIS